MQESLLAQLSASPTSSSRPWKCTSWWENFSNHKHFTEYLQFSSSCYYDQLITATTVQHGCYGLRTAGLIISICLALPWPLLVLCLTNRCNKTLRKLQEKQVQVKKTIVSLLPSLQGPLSPSSFKINVPTSANPGELSAWSLSLPIWIHHTNTIHSNIHSNNKALEPTSTRTHSKPGSPAPASLSEVSFV